MNGTWESAGGLQAVDWDEALARRGSADAQTGLRVVRLAGDDGFCTFVAWLEAGAEVPAHHHEAGDEHYHVLQGRGELALRELDRGGRCVVAMHQRQSFVVPPRVVHALRNVGREPLLLMFSCDASHLDGDRHFADAV